MSFDALREAVNRSRYRGPHRDEPMTDSFHWPMSWAEYEHIAAAALLLVCESEKAESAAGKEAR